jgi:1-acyl-sn-glycerol-3-phosphate acyltransferase
MLNILKNYVIFTFKLFYGEFIVIGKENIPVNSPVIFAPNHLNALMDALAIHSIAPSNSPVTFLARADLFNNKRLGKFLRYIKILPAFRMRDGMENLAKNNLVFESCVDILLDNKTLGIMPEGNQGEQRQLRTFGKGIFRIAFAAQQKLDNNKTVKIIPVGIDFGSLHKFGKHIIINIGKPINVIDYMEIYSENNVTATNEIKDRLYMELSNLTLNISSKTNYECFETSIEIANSSLIDGLEIDNKTIMLFEARQQIANRLLMFEKTDSNKINILKALCAKYQKLIKRLNFKTWIFDEQYYRTAPLLFECLLLCISFPAFIIGFILNLLPFFVPVLIRKNLNVEYKGFFSSIHYVLGIITFPFFYLIQTILFASLTSSTWVEILIFFCSQYIIGKWALEWYRFAKKILAKIRYNNLVINKSTLVLETQDIRKKIIQLIKN